MTSRTWTDQRAAYLLMVCRQFLEVPKAASARNLARSTAASHARAYGADTARWPGATS